MEIDFRYKHGDTGTRLYRIWTQMKNRCNGDEANMWHGYHRYGGRGIKVCKSWHEYTTFKKWAMKHGYNEKMTIDRIDNDGNYSPLNCQFLTRSENSSKGIGSFPKRYKLPSDSDPD